MVSEANQPWWRSPRRRWCPREMIRPPILDPVVPTGPIQPRYALLINPFYPKDPNASFGKHVLTPTLALTSFAATTPEHWEVRYWDENSRGGRSSLRNGTEVAEARSCWVDYTSCRAPKSVRRTRTRLLWAMACGFGRGF